MIIIIIPRSKTTRKGPSLAVGSLGTLAPVGAAISVASPGLIAGGIAATEYGYALHRNANKLSKMGMSEGRRGIKISERNDTRGLKHIMKRHKYNTKEIDASKFNKDMSKFDIKRSIQKGWKCKHKKFIKTSKGSQEWNVEMSKPIGFGQEGSKTKMLKIIVNKNTNEIISAYPF